MTFDNFTDLREDAIEFLWEYGQRCHVVNWDLQLRDDNTPEKTNEQTLEWRCEITEPGSPQFAERAEGFRAEIDAVIWLPQEHDGTTPTIRSGDKDDTVASVIRLLDDSDNTRGEYTVRTMYPEPNGRLRCHCMQDYTEVTF